MQERVALVGPPESPADVRGLSSFLPPDLMEQVRGRIPARPSRASLRSTAPRLLRNWK